MEGGREEEERRGGKKRRKGERGKRESNIRGVCVDVRWLLLHALVWVVTAVCRVWSVRGDR